VEQLIDEVHAAPTAPGTGRLLVPGELEWGRLAAAREHGIPLPSDVLSSLRDSAGIAGLDLAGYLAPGS
jgi:LDH2 family malate/lactate/ureidoglycolate dehydrogenase